MHASVERVLYETHVEEAVTLAEAAVEHTRSLVDKAMRTSAADGPVTRASVTQAFDAMMAVLKKLHNVSDCCKEASANALVPVDRRIGPPNSCKQWFAFNSIGSLIADTLAKDKHARTSWVATSESWKTGAFREEPAVLSDIVHGRKFRESPLSRRAGPGEERRVRIGVALWNDDATVHSLPN